MRSRWHIPALAIEGCVLVAIMAYLAPQYAGGDVSHRVALDDVANAALASAKTSGEDYGAGAAGCEVTKPKRRVRVPSLGWSRHWIARHGLYVSFGKKTTIAVPPSGEPPPLPGTLYATIESDGSIGQKVPWFRDRRAWGRLRVEAVRRPGGDRLVKTSYDNHLGRKSKVVPGGMVFPRGGCWHIKARSGDAGLRAVVWVVNLYEGEGDEG